jgi:hypothetical protein
MELGQAFSSSPKDDFNFTGRERTIAVDDGHEFLPRHIPRQKNEFVVVLIETPILTNMLCSYKRPENGKLPLDSEERRVEGKHLSREVLPGDLILSVVYLNRETSTVEKLPVPSSSNI